MAGAQTLAGTMADRRVADGKLAGKKFYRTDGDPPEN